MGLKKRREANMAISSRQDEDSDNRIMIATRRGCDRFLLLERSFVLRIVASLPPFWQIRALELQCLKRSRETSPNKPSCGSLKPTPCSVNCRLPKLPDLIELKHG
jgi:hypothetical protein